MSIDIAQEDTICALASAQGPCAISLIRVCGNGVLKLIPKLIGKDVTPLQATYAKLLNSNREVVDEVICIYYPAKKSFCGQDTLEINCHGNPLIVEEILSLLNSYNVRLAKPGEFTLRAVLNQKIDLCQAESIVDLIHAKSLVAKKTALKGLSGGLMAKCLPIYELLTDVLAEIEARMDFVDDDLGHYDTLMLQKKMTQAHEEISRMLDSADYGLKLHEGVRVVLCGLPNAGKSTLLNRLAKAEKAIVHNEAGTTRDVIETNILLDDMPLVLVDIAGIRDLSQAQDVEKIGINKAFQEVKRADVILWLEDAKEQDPFSDETIKELLVHKEEAVIKVINKIDAHTPKHASFCVAISAKNGDNIEGLIKAIKGKVLTEQHCSEEVLVTKLRQKEELLLAQKACACAIEALDEGMVDEIITSELRQAGLALDRLLGKSLSENILDKIFSQFCIGK